MMAWRQEVTDPDTVVPSRFWKFLRIVGLSLALVFLMGVAAGFLASHLERHGGIDALAVAFLGALALVTIACGWLMLREIRKPTGEEPLTPKERLNRNILIGCGLLGGIMGVVMAVSGDGGLANGTGVFSNEPLPAGVAIVLVLIVGVLVPAISIYWHRLVDEQEADAYKTGALFAFYVYALGAPLWWLAWRGGFAPSPNGFVIYFATMLTVGSIWLWKKYR